MLQTRTENEIQRISNVGNGDYEVVCIECGKVITLFYNGGELDQSECCGNIYRLESTQTDLVVVRPFVDKTLLPHTRKLIQGKTFIRPSFHIEWVIKEK